MTLAQLQAFELDEDSLAQLVDEQFPSTLALQLESDQAREGVKVLSAAMALISKKVDQELLDELAADYANIYLIHQYSASPCESVWIDEDGLTMQEPMFQIRKWYKKYQLEVPDWRQRTDDHLVFQLQFIASLLEKEDEESLKDAAQFMDEHLLRWINDFSRRIASRAMTPFYAGLVILTSAYVEELRDVMVHIIGEARPGDEEIEQRMKPKKQVEVEVPSAYVPGQSPSW